VLAARRDTFAMQGDVRWPRAFLNRAVIGGSVEADSIGADPGWRICMKRALRNAALAGAALVVAGGAAMAATAAMHTMNVAMPDGSVARIEYIGDVAPKVTIQPVAPQQAAFAGPFGATMPAFADLDRVSAMMDQQVHAMMQRAEAMQVAAASAGGQPGMVTVSSNLPKGSYHYEFVSTTSGNGGCTQTVSWSSDGSGAQPKMTRASTGDCGSAKSGAVATVPVSTEARPAAAAVPAKRV
jgi:hypothetical protein